MVGRERRCPACGETVTDPWCGSCGLELASDEAERIRELIAQVDAARANLNDAWTRHDQLARVLEMRRASRVKVASATTGPASPPPSYARSGHEWDVERVRNVLLWSGAALLACSALAFTAVAWTHLGPAGRALLLFALTVVVGVLACATRTRLPATSGALTGLAIALALVDWSILRRAGVAPGLSLSAFWAIGTAVIGVGSIGFGRIAAPVPTRRAATLLLPIGGVLAVVSWVSASWTAAVGCSALATALVAADRTAGRRTGDRVLRLLLHAETVVIWLGASIAALVAAVQPDTFVETLAPAFAVASLALAPVVAGAWSDRDEDHRVWFSVLAVVAGFAATLTLTSTSVGAIGQVTLVALLGSGALVSAPSLSTVRCRALQRVGVGSVALGIVTVGTTALVAEFGPLSWLQAAWTGDLGADAAAALAGPDTVPEAVPGWCAVAVLIASAAAIALTTRRQPRDEQAFNPLFVGASCGALALVGVAAAPVAAGATARVAFTAVLLAVLALVAAGAVTSRRRADAGWIVGALACVPLVPGVGWAAMTSTASIVGLVVVALAATGAAAYARSDPLRAINATLAGSAIATLAAVVVLASGGSAAAGAFAGATAGGILLVLGAQLRRDTAEGVALEATGVGGLAVGVSIAAQSEVWLAGVLTVAVPCLLVAAVRAPRRIAYGIGAGVAALGATWAWLAAADVRVVEAYTVPAAIAALVAGTLAKRDVPGRSWPALGPAIVLALGPTLVLAIARNDDTRAILIGSVAVAVVVIGATRRLQAPIVLGTGTLVVLAVDKLGPTATRLPRWLMLALAGSILLWVGTTFERRRADVQRALRGFERFS